MKDSENAVRMEYLRKICSRINDTQNNILYIAQMDHYIEDYLYSEYAKWKKKTRDGGTVYLPRYNKDYQIVRVSEGSRGYKPKHAIIDSRIPLETIKIIIEPSLIVCASCYYF